jgi:hypothetical protein
MKLEIPFLAACLFMANDLLARVAVHGIEQGLFSAALEWCMKHAKTSRRNGFAGFSSDLQSRIQNEDALRVVR